MSVRHGFTTPDPNEALVKKTALKQCNIKYILTDSEKFDNVSSVKFADFGEIHILTDKIPGNYKNCSEGIIYEV